MHVCKYILLIPLKQTDIILIPPEANHEKIPPNPQTNSTVETWLLSLTTFRILKFSYLHYFLTKCHWFCETSFFSGFITTFDWLGSFPDLPRGLYKVDAFSYTLHPVCGIGEISERPSCITLWSKMYFLTKLILLFQLIIFFNYIE